MHNRNTTPVPNRLLDDYLPHLKPVELKVLLLIVRKTLGWQKEIDWISLGQFIEKTGASKRAIHQALKSLVDAGWIRIESRRGRRHYAFKTEQKCHPGGAKSAPQAVTKLPPTKDTLTKNTCTKGKKCPSEKLMAIRKELGSLGIIRDQ